MIEISLIPNRLVKKAHHQTLPLNPRYKKDSNKKANTSLKKYQL